MNGTLTTTRTAALTQIFSNDIESAAKKKVVLLLGYSAEVRQKQEQGAKKNRMDVRPPPRWGLND